jgi:hypothetical protein
LRRLVLGLVMVGGRHLQARTGCELLSQAGDAVLRIERKTELQHRVQAVAEALRNAAWRLDGISR